MKRRQIILKMKATNHFQVVHHGERTCGPAVPDVDGGSGQKPGHLITGDSNYQIEQEQRQIT